MQIKAICVLALLILTIFLLNGCTQKNPGSSSSSPAFNDLQSVLDSCKECVNSSPSVCFIKINCVFSKVSSSEQCLDLNGRVQATIKDVPVIGTDTTPFTDTDVSDCIGTLAVKQNNPTLCNKSPMKQDCFEKVALDTNNFDHCNTSPSQEACLTKFAVANKLLLPCIKIIDTNQRVECKKQYGLSSNKFSGCISQTIQSLAQLSCFLKKIELTKEESNNPNVCGILDAISPSIENNRCKAAFGLYFEDTKLCDSSGNVIQECYSQLAQLSTKITLQDCDKAGAGYVFCYKGLAIRDKNAEICTQYVPNSQKDDCYNEVALITNNFSDCFKISDTSEAGYCAESVFQRTCSSQNDCNVSINDCDIINKIISRGFDNIGLKSDICYYNVAIKNSDKLACQKIQNQQSKQECLDILAHS
jgi:hypothetical protein